MMLQGEWVRQSEFTAKHTAAAAAARTKKLIKIYVSGENTHFKAQKNLDTLFNSLEQAKWEETTNFFFFLFQTQLFPPQLRRALGLYVFDFVRDNAKQLSDDG